MGSPHLKLKVFNALLKVIVSHNALLKVPLPLPLTLSLCRNRLLQCRQRRHLPSQRSHLLLELLVLYLKMGMRAERRAICLMRPDPRGHTS